VEEVLWKERVFKRKGEGRGRRERLENRARQGDKPSPRHFKSNSAKETSQVASPSFASKQSRDAK
jgi:hypothetical protein